jgi:hypothetical protein
LLCEAHDCRFGSGQSHAIYSVEAHQLPRHLRMAVCPRLEQRRLR